MSIKLAIAGRPHVVLEETNITLGSAPGCSVIFPDQPDVKPKHAVIRNIAGRWLIEVRDAESILIAGNEQKRLYWLSPGDVFRLTENGPSITFQPTDDVPISAATQKPNSVPEVIVLPDSDPSIRVADSVAQSPNRLSAFSLERPDSAPLSAYQLKTPPSSATMRTSSPPPIDVTSPDSDLKDVAPNVPMLTRSSSWSGPAVGLKDVVNNPDQLDAHSESDRSPDEVADVEWIKMVVGRCFFAGFIFVILWIAARELWSAFFPPNYGVSSSVHSQTKV